MDKGITRLSKDSGAAPNPLDALVDAVADKIVEKLKEQPRYDPQGVNWISMKEAAEKTGVSYHSIATAVRTGELPAYTPMGKKVLDPLEVDEWIKNQPARNQPPRIPRTFPRI